MSLPKQLLDSIIITKEQWEEYKKLQLQINKIKFIVERDFDYLDIIEDIESVLKEEDK